MREVTIPSKTFFEEVRSLEEFVGTEGTPGMVKVAVARCDERGRFLGIPATMYSIEGEDYQKLVGDGEGWATPGKPVGTYRNEDLWYFIDAIRLAQQGG